MEVMPHFYNNHLAIRFVCHGAAVVKSVSLFAFDRNETTAQNFLLEHHPVLFNDVPLPSPRNKKLKGLSDWLNIK